MLDVKSAYTVAYVTVWGVIIWTLFNILTIIYNIYGPVVETKYYHPVISLDFTTARCVGRDAYVFGDLDKRKYLSGASGEFQGLTFYPVNGGDRLPWRRVNESDKSPESRPPGQQGLGVYMVGGCSTAFTARTTHLSPITGFQIYGSYGPFSPIVIAE